MVIVLQAALAGNILHHGGMAAAARVIVARSPHKLLEVGLTEVSALGTLMRAINPLLRWLRLFLRPTPDPAAKAFTEQDSHGPSVRMCIQEVQLP